MRSPSRWLSPSLALSLLLCACGDDGRKGDSDDVNPGDLDASASDGQVADNARDAASRDATLSNDARANDGAARPADAAVESAPDGAVAPGSNGEGGAGDAAPSSDAESPRDAAQDGQAPEDDAAASDAGVNDAGASDAAAELGDAGDDAGAVDAGSSVCSAPVLGRFGLQTVVSSNVLSGLTEATQPPGSSDWYLTEQRGRVMVLRAGQSEVEAQPFLDITSEIVLRTTGYEDRGLVSIAFAPDYASSGLVYVSVTPNRGDYTNVDLLLEYKRSETNPYQLDPGSRRVIVELRGRRTDTDFITVNIHNGGRVAFGPDGKLYLAMGDGGGVNCGDTEPDGSQDVNSLFGKILRLDLSQPAPYGAVDNPFVSNGDARVWQYGLRNPFRFSFDRANGDFYIGDVGQNRYEELDYAPSGVSGLNFGWSPYEGNSRDTCPTRAMREGSTHTPPIFVADRRGASTSPFADLNAMIGGVVYRGTALPELVGVYLFGGYQSRRLGALRQCGETTSPITPVLKSCDINEPNSPCLTSLGNAPRFSELRAIVEDEAGEIYVVANGNSLLKVVASP